MMLELHAVTAGYGDTTVLRGVSLSVAAGRVAALLGPNGAGKTTLLRTASGLLAPSAGTVIMDGEDVTTRQPHDLVKRGMCHVPEGRAIFPSLTVRENIRAFATKREELHAVERAFSAFPILGQRASQRAGTLSGGEQQMLALARAWIRDPRLVLIDEPTLGLAPLIVHAVYEFLEKLASGGSAMLIVEQYVDKALALADDVYVLVHGEIVLNGTADNIDRDALAHHYIATDKQT
jgi:branched-chain amino acid transport system ATP-binding protein